MSKLDFVYVIYCLLWDAANVLRKHSFHMAANTCRDLAVETSKRWRQDWHETE